MKQGRSGESSRVSSPHPAALQRARRGSGRSSRRLLSSIGAGAADGSRRMTSEGDAAVVLRQGGGAALDVGGDRRQSRDDRSVKPLAPRAGRLTESGR